jgi:hypothetical protein
MSRHFTFIVRDKKFEGYKKIASFFFLINAILFFFWAQASPGTSRRMALFMIAAVLVVYAIYHWLYKQKKEKSFIVIYLLVTTVWVTETSYWYAGLLFLLLLILQARMENDFWIRISSARITISSLIRKHYEWSAFDNIVLKDGLLTLDFKNNRIIQAEPDGKYWENGASTETGNYTGFEQDFNEFCREHLVK